MAVPSWTPCPSNWVWSFRPCHIHRTRPPEAALATAGGLRFSRRAHCNLRTKMESLMTNPVGSGPRAPQGDHSSVAKALPNRPVPAPDIARRANKQRLRTKLRIGPDIPETVKTIDGHWQSRAQAIVLPDNPTASGARPDSSVCMAREPKRDSNHICGPQAPSWGAGASHSTDCPVFLKFCYSKRCLNLCFKMNRMRFGSPKPFTTSGVSLGKTEKRAIFHRNFRVHLGCVRAESRGIGPALRDRLKFPSPAHRRR